VTDGGQTGSARRPWYLWVGVALVALVAVVALAVVVRSGAQDDYDDAVQQRFLAACTAQGGDPVRDTCACFYDEIVAAVPFDRFELLDASLATQVQGPSAGPLALPADIQALLDGCVARTA
jgi:hypothetical protein